LAPGVFATEIFSTFNDENRSEKFSAETEIRQIDPSLNPRFVNSGTSCCTRPSSVVHTGVKSAGWLQTKIWRQI
jgi:hypothetical protein